LQFKEINRDQTCLLPQSIKELIPEKDCLHSILNVVDKLDISKIEQKYDNTGQHAYHPKMMIAIVFYAYSKGIFSSRSIEEAVRYDVRFMYITGRYRPSFNRICEFKRKNYDELSDCFTQIVRLCLQLGVATFESISVDGTKLGASASRKKNKSREAIEKELSEIKEKLQQIIDHGQHIDEIECDGDILSLDEAERAELEERQAKLEQAKAVLDADEKQTVINMTDLDCREQSGVGPGFNAQAAASSEYYILGADVVSDPNDAKQLIPMIEQVEHNTRSEGQKKAVNADAGYASGRNFLSLRDFAHIDAYIPPALLHQPRPLFHKDNFDFDATHLTCSCPLNKPMKLYSREKRYGVMTYRFSGTVCTDCPAKHLCTSSKRRTVRFSEADYLTKAMTDKMRTPFGKRAMRERRQTIEPIFGIIKSHLGFKEFLHRGLEKVRGEFKLVCAAFNLKKLHKDLIALGNVGVLPQLANIISSFLLFISKICKTAVFTFRSGIYSTLSQSF